MEKLEIGNFCCFIWGILIFMPQTLKKLWSTCILVSACLSIRCYKLGLSGFVFVPNTFMWLNGFVWLVRLHHFYAPNFEKVGDILVMPPTLKKLMGHIAFGGCVGGCVGHTFCTYCNF